MVPMARDRAFSLATLSIFVRRNRNAGLTADYGNYADKSGENLTRIDANGLD